MTSPVPGPRRRAWARLARVLGIALVCLAATELVATLALDALGRGRGMQLHLDYGWRMRPGIARAGPMWGARRPARTNAAGWRDAERSRVVEPGVRRIVVLGDSFTFGVGVDDGERFTDLLDVASDDVEVLNFGVNGYGTDQELRVLEEEALAYGPSVVVCVTYLGNDLLDIVHSVRHRWPKPHFTLRAGELELHEPDFPLLVRLRSRFSLAEGLAAALDLTGRGVSAVREDVDDAEALLVALLRQMDDASRGAGARFLVVLVHEPGIDPEVKQRVTAALDAAGVEILDLEPPFERAGGRELFNSPPVGHWNAAGHAVVADALRVALD